jgi:ribosomal protein S27E
MTKENLWKIPTPPQNTSELDKEEQIVYNAVKCLECNETIVSYHQHDYVTCNCDNQASVDGGLSYLRYGAKDLSKITKITYTVNDPFDLIREFMSWGTYGKDGKAKLTYVKIKDMSDDHIRKVLVHRASEWVKDILRQELDYRAEFNISITD